MGLAEKEEKKLSFRSVTNQTGIENSKKIAKKFKKLKNIIRASFKAKTGRERQRKGEKKIIVPISSYSTRNREFRKNSNKIQKIKKYHYVFISNQNESGEAEKERKKNIIVTISSYPTRNRELKKNSKRIQKIKKHPNGFISSQNGSGEAEKEKKKNYRSDRCLTDQE